MKGMGDKEPERQKDREKKRNTQSSQGGKVSGEGPCDSTEERKLKIKAVLESKSFVAQPGSQSSS